MNKCPKYKCGCTLPQCAPRDGRCAAMGTAPGMEESNQKEGIKKMECEKRGGKECLSLACTSKNKCAGDVCPVDGEICALGKCVVGNACHWDDYYPNDKSDGKPGDGIMTDRQFAPATIPIHSTPQSQSTTYKTYNVAAFKRDCHKPMTRITGGPHAISLALGGRSDWLGWRERADITLHLTGRTMFMHEPETVMGNDEARSILPPSLLHDTKGARIAIEWPDFEVPELGAVWWNDFIAWAIEQAERATIAEPFTIAVHCEGGHGRTGTAAAILACGFDMVPEGQCPVTWLRNVYCSSAVESDEQIRYITLVTGREVKADVRHMFGGMGGEWPMHTAEQWPSYGKPVAKPVVKVQAPSRPLSVEEHIKLFKTREDIAKDGKLSKSRRKKLMRLWDRAKRLVT